MGASANGFGLPGVGPYLSSIPFGSYSADDLYNLVEQGVITYSEALAYMQQGNTPGYQPPWEANPDWFLNSLPGIPAPGTLEPTQENPNPWRELTDADFADMAASDPGGNATVSSNWVETGQSPNPQSNPSDIWDYLNGIGVVIPGGPQSTNTPAPPPPMTVPYPGQPPVVASTTVTSTPDTNSAWKVPTAVGAAGLAGVAATLGVTQPTSAPGGMNTNFTPYPQSSGGTVGGGTSGGKGGPTAGGSAESGRTSRSGGMNTDLSPYPETTTRRGGPTYSGGPEVTNRTPHGGTVGGPGETTTPPPPVVKPPAGTPNLPDIGGAKGSIQLPQSNIGIHQHAYSLPDTGPVQSALAQADASGNELIIAGEDGPEMVYGKGVVLPMSKDKTMQRRPPFPVRGLARGGTFGEFMRRLPVLAPQVSAQTPGFNPNATTPQVRPPATLPSTQNHGWNVPGQRAVPPVTTPSPLPKTLPKPAPQPTAAEAAYQAAVTAPTPQPKTSMWQRLAAAGAAGMGGWVNASGKARTPQEVIQGAANNIKYPNLPERLRQHQDGIDTTGAALKLEQERIERERQAQQDELNTRKVEAGINADEANTALRSAQADDLRRTTPRVAQTDIEKIEEKYQFAIDNGRTPEEALYLAYNRNPPKADDGSALKVVESVDEKKGVKVVVAFDTKTGEEKVRHEIPYSKAESGNKPSGSFKAEYDSEGNLLGYHNPTTNERKSPGFSDAQKPMSASAKKRKEEIASMLASLDQLSALAERHKSHIGPVVGRATAATRGLIGVVGASGEDEAEIHDMYRIADDLSDRLLRARSGAQINEREFARLRKLVPDPKDNIEKFQSDMRTFRAELSGLSSSETQQSTPTPVLMRNPNTGTVGLIPPERVAEAEARNFERVEE